MNRAKQIEKLHSLLKLHGFGYDVTTNLDMNYGEDDTPFAHIDFDLAETKYDANIRAAIESDLQLDVTDKGITLQLK